MRTYLYETLHLFTFTKEILNAKLQFLCSGSNCKYRKIFYENKKVVQNGLQLIQKLRIAKSLNIYILQLPDIVTIRGFEYDKVQNFSVT